jgi:hypothetical protein
MNQENGHGEKRSWKQEQLIAAPLSHPTIEAAAKGGGHRGLTAWRWGQDTTFAERYREATREAMSQAAALLPGGAHEAVDTLRAIQSEGQSEAARISAARTILEMAVKAADLEDVQRRLDTLEVCAIFPKEGGHVSGKTDGAFAGSKTPETESYARSKLGANG